MRCFDYSGLAGRAWPQGLKDALDKVRRLQALLAEGARARSRLAVLNEEQALVTCAVHSCAIDGREVDGPRLLGIGFGIMEPASLEEQEALGMFEAMQDILVRHASMDVSAQTILALHRTMEGHARPSQAGRFRRRPNSLARDWPGHEGMARVETLEPEDVPEAVELMCQAWNRASARRDVDGVMLAGFAVVDFLCIAPFARRNGRMSRLLAMLLLCKAGHAPLAAALTASVQRRIQSVYADVLALACADWRQGLDVPMLSAVAQLQMLAEAYQTCLGLREMLDGTLAPSAEDFKDLLGCMGKEGRALAYALLKPGGRFTTADAAGACPDLDRQAVLEALKVLEGHGLVVRHGTGKGTSWECAWRPHRIR